jgi:hypothetical protein
MSKSKEPDIFKCVLFIFVSIGAILATFPYGSISLNGQYLLQMGLVLIGILEIIVAVQKKKGKKRSLSLIANSWTALLALIMALWALETNFNLAGLIVFYVGGTIALGTIINKEGYGLFFIFMILWAVILVNISSWLSL